MKKFTYLLLAYAYLFLLLLTAGCGDKCSGCPEDVEFPAEMELRVPYQVGQVVRFANAAGDTIVLNCTSREYSQEERFALERPQSECCPSYFVENILCKMSGIDDSFLNIRTDYNGGYRTIISANLEGVGYLGDYFPNRIDSVVLNGKTFYDILTTEENGEEIFMYIGANQGIIGFTINGEEWALIE